MYMLPFLTRSYCSLKIYSETTSVGWYMNDEMIKLHGDDWTQEMCKLWYDQEMESMDWIDDLVPCPMTGGHAYTDYGSFIIDAGFKPAAEECQFSATECVLGVFPK